MRDRIWLSFDFTEQRDRPRLYRWLAAHKARECGPHLASLVYSYAEDLLKELTVDLTGQVELTPADRVYLIYKDPYDGEMTGLFIIGRRAGQHPGRGFAGPTLHPLAIDNASFFRTSAHAHRLQPAGRCHPGARPSAAGQGIWAWTAWP